MGDRAFEVGGVTSLIYLAAIVNQIYNFRNGHWQFVQKYIMRSTTYLVATGGTPLNLWLPNQIRACLNKMEELLGKIKSHADQLGALPKDVHSLYTTLNADHDGKVKLLTEQMAMLRTENFHIEEVIKLDDRQT
jgi:indoleamine 2,3-dioxygenase